MPELEDVLSAGGDAGPQLFEGEFATTPQSVDEPALVIIPFVDPEHSYGPCPWAPRVLEDGTVDMPTEGDTCLVAMGTAGEDGNLNPWVVLWWPYG